MAYEDLKNTILNNYGGQDNVPDSVYNALYKFKQNGQDALDDRDYAILSEAKTYKLPEVTEPSTMEFAAFAHPTTSEKAAKWAQENQEKDTYKVDQLAGRSAAGPNQEDASFADYLRQSDNPILSNIPDMSVVDYLKHAPSSMLSNLQDLYGGLKETAATGIAPVVASVAKGAEKIGLKDADVVPWTDTEGVVHARTLPDRTIYQRSLENIEGAKQGEGVTGLLADPLNATFLLPGLGEYALGSKLGAAAMASKIGTKIPQTLVRGALGGVEGAGMGLIGSKIDRSREGVDVGDAMLFGAGGGALGSALGGMLKGRAVDNFPGAEKLEKAKMGGKKNVGMNELSEAERIRVYEDLPIFAGREKYFNLGNQYTEHAGAGFSKADEIFDNLLEKYGYPYGGVSTDAMERIIREGMLKEAKARGLLQNLVDEAQIDDFVKDRMAKIKFTAAQTPRKIDKTFGEMLNLPESSTSVIPVSNFGSILGNFNTDVGRLVSKNPTAESKMALVARNAVSDNMRGPLGSVDVADILRTGSLPGQSYGDVLERLQPGTMEKYKLGRKLLTNVANQVETGPSMRLGMPGMSEVSPHIYLRPKSNYVIPNLEYKLGKFLSTPFGASLSSRIPEGYVSYKEWKDRQRGQ